MVEAGSDRLDVRDRRRIEQAGLVDDVAGEIGQAVGRDANEEQQGQQHGRTLTHQGARCASVRASRAAAISLGNSMSGTCAPSAWMRSASSFLPRLLRASTITRSRRLLPSRAPASVEERTSPALLSVRATSRSQRLSSDTSSTRGRDEGGESGSPPKKRAPLPTPLSAPRAPP